MSLCRPKILSVVTVPTGGWTIKIYISDADEGAPQYSDNFTSTIPAGDYFISGDNQDDDLLEALQTQVAADIATALTGFVGGGVGLEGHLGADIHPTTHKVRLQFLGTAFRDATNDRDVKIAWTESSSDLADALGFDSSADDESTTSDNPIITADWQHAYGWYAEEDGTLLSLMQEDINTSKSLRSRAIDGGIDTQFIGEWFDNELQLQFLERNEIYSNGVGYTETPVYPYEKNKGLECWWREAMQGKRFRVYRDSYINTARANDRGIADAASTTTTLVDADKSWDTDPQTYKGCILFLEDFFDDLVPVPAAFISLNQSFYISSHTATILTVPNARAGLDLEDAPDSLYYIFDHTYKTYVISERMDKFEPKEIPNLNRFNINIQLSRYIA